MLAIFEKMGVPVDVTSLAYGDVAFIGNGPDGPVKVGIEIKGGKAGADFLDSMCSERLAGHQIPGLTNLYDRSYLIIEGLRPTKSGLLWTIPHGRRQRPIFTIDVKRYVTGLEESGVRVRWTRTPEDTAKVIVKELLAFWSKDYDSHTSVNALYRPVTFTLRREDEATTRLRRMAACLPHIGAGRSKPVAKHFGTIHRLVNAPEEEWRSIEGVGPTTAGDVVRAIHEVAGIHAAPARGVPAKRRAADRSARHSGKREDRELDAGKRAQRSVSTTRARR